MTADRPATEPRTDWLAQQVVLACAERRPIGDLLMQLREAERAEAAQGAAPRAEGPAEIPETMEAMPTHDNGCRCWPHVSRRDAERMIERVALAEYRSGAAPRAEGLDEWRGFAVLVADTCNDPRLVREAERLLGLSRPSDERVPESEEPR